MSTRATSAAIAMVRAWTRLYTCGLPRAERERRRAEIESDIWESVNDPAPQLSLQILVRLALGVVDDLCWRVEQSKIGASQRQAIAMSTAAAVLAVCVWIGWAAQRVEPPQPPHPPDLEWRYVHRKPLPPPPPPPPPPCNPAGIGRPAFAPCTPYPVAVKGGRT